MKPIIRAGLLCVALLIGARVAHAQSASTPSAPVAQRAVAEFYAWYVPMWANDPGPAMRAVRERRAQFADPLIKALRADSIATAQAGEEIDGLDGDPFLNGQDPCDRYRPVRTTRRGDDYFVDVLGSGGCQRHTTPDVIVHVAWREQRPVFVNFLYSGKPGDDLQSLLRRLAVQRQRERSAP